MTVDWLRTAFHRALITRVPRDHTEPDRAFRRRRLVVATTFLIGAGLLGVSLRVEPGDDRFYWLTALLALVWAVGGLLSGPLHLGYVQVGRRFRRPVLTPVVVGATLAVVFVVGALVIRAVPLLRGYVDDVLAYATYGNLAVVVVIAVVNGVAEELFFRGGLFAAIGRRSPVLISTVAYALATVATGNLMLVFAAAVVGVVLGLQRRASGGILAPVITHVTWSLLMLLLLPVLLLR
ncbi:CPBP family intramembrane metalloprotease [Natronosporangium hydrolyticum]|uniref:CPBP family intramembrane metalloprotease n=1 Tax=Natronosporangium hydrolyticum TaxID=2811111 RepID=A0A895YII7_9ACTN|nr:CPBP family glutamic-type intramembrane protease [Natronosporangium hydrolyticum]QSB15825.1 CPBP family intramembrane metalloprotease [Natronosporangium hydrolyticum]